MDRNLVLFGTSELAKEYLKLVKKRGYKVLCYCDNDPTKWDKSIEGIKIVSPDYLKELNSNINFHIIITSIVHRNEIAEQLIKMGLYKFKFIDKKQLETNSRYLWEQNKKNTVIFSGYLFENSRLQYLKKLDEQLNIFDYEIFYVNQSNQELKIDNCIKWNRYNSKVEDIIYDISIDEDIHFAAACDMEYYNDDFSTCLEEVLKFYYFMKKIFLKKKPKLCILFHQFNGMHIALRKLCEDLGVSYLFAEEGVLPETFCFEIGGQMAQSWVAEKTIEFLNLPIGEYDYKVALEYLSFAKEQKLTRKSQTEELLLAEIIKEQRKRGRKILFYAGQNDYRAGIVPYWLPFASRHSPYYINTIDALNHLIELAERNNWYIIYKPHPNIERKWTYSDIVKTDRLSIVRGANVFECILETDVTLTILSQVSYLSLIQEKPTVLLGRNQLSGKKCTYEINSSSETEYRIIEAIEQFNWETKKEAWLKHVAQICKYYVFAKSEKTERIIGRGIPEAARFIIRNSSYPLSLY